MILIDTHTHLYDTSFDADIFDVIKKSKNAGVMHALLPNIDVESINALKNLVLKDSEYFKPMMGLHPCSVTEKWENDLAIIKKELDEGNYIAVGEIGLDFHWDLTHKDAQILAFREQLQWAKDKKLPVSIHSRKAYADILKILKEEKTDNLRGVLHCFGGDLAEAYKAIEMGFYLGIGGVVTYKNAGMAEIVKEINLEHIILETDAPYLPPVPYRGKRNESAYIFEIASFIADIKNKSVEEVAMITTQNAKTLYKF